MVIEGTEGIAVTDKFVMPIPAMKFFVILKNNARRRTAPACQVMVIVYYLKLLIPIMKMAEQR